MIIVTRPSPEGNELTELLNQAGISALHLPLFDITAGRELLALQNKLSRLTYDDIVIVVSPQVTHLITLSQLQLNFPHHVHYFAIGKKSANLFRKLAGIQVNYPKQEDSEGLLQLFESKSVTITNQNVLILRGNSGRELLANDLLKKQAKVEYIECYQRNPVIYSQGVFNSDITKQIIVISNVENLTQLESNITNEHKKYAQLIVTSIRIADKAKTLGWNKINLANSANNKILFKTIVTLCHNGK